MSEEKNPVCNTTSSTKSTTEILDDTGEGTFPASDAPASGKITGPNDCQDDDDKTEKPADKAD